MMKKNFGAGCCLTSIIMIMAAITPVYSEAMDALSRRRMNEKLEFFRVSYPAFNYQDAAKAAEAAYPLAGSGGEVSIQTYSGRVSGVFQGGDENSIVIDRKVILLKDIVEQDRHLFLPAENEKLRRAHIENLFLEYSRKRAADLAAYQRQLNEKLSLDIDPLEDLRQQEEAEARRAAALAPARYGLVIKNILMASGSIRTGDIVANIRRTGYERYSFETGDARTVSTDAGNIFILEELSTLDPFEVSQAALQMLSRNNYQDALYYAIAAAASDVGGKRVEPVTAYIAAMQELSRDVAVATEKIRALSRQLEQHARTIASNQDRLNDDFAVKAGAGDRRASLMARMIVLREQRKALRLELKEKIFSVCARFVGEIKTVATIGDFIAACILTDSAEKRFGDFMAMPDVEWQQEERRKIQDAIEALKDFITAEYRRKINRPAKDRWEFLLDRYADTFGDDEHSLSRLDVRPDYRSLHAASVRSFSVGKLYFEAVGNKRFSEIFFGGMYLLTIMPEAPAVENIYTVVEEQLQTATTLVRQVRELEKQRGFFRISGLKAEFGALPLELRQVAVEAEKAVNAASAMAGKAADAEKEGKYDIAVDSLHKALEICPDHPEIQNFANEFRERHPLLLRHYPLFRHNLARYHYVEAMEKWRQMFKELPQYRPFVQQLQQRLNDALDNYAREMVQAENYRLAGRYRDALEIFRKYGETAKKKPVYAAMLESAQARQDWAEAVRMLELLERWEEAGELRRRHRLPH